MAKRCPFCAEEIQDEAIKCKHCLSWLGPGPDPAGASPAAWDVGPAKAVGVFERLRRPKDDRMVAGVCSAFGRYLGIDPTLVRITSIVTTFFTAIVPGVILYLILALVIPTEEDGRHWAP